jgi:hypothetical protein
MNTVQMIHTHVCKNKNDTCWNFQSSLEGGWKRTVKQWIQEPL